jgi:hypothetical protein
MAQLGSSKIFGKLQVTGSLAVYDTTAATSTSTGALLIAGGLGVAGNVWATGFNSLTLATASTGFTIAGGTTSKTLTLSESCTLNQNLASSASPTFADLTLSGGDLICSTTTTFNLVNSVATTLNIGGASTATTIGSSSSSAYVRVAGTTAATSGATGALRVAGGLGVAGAVWGSSFNGLTLTAQTAGFTVAGGTASKTLTVNESCAIGALTAGYVLYASAANTISSEQYVTIAQGGTGASVVSARQALMGAAANGAVGWRAITAADISDLSSADTAITSVGTITTGTWHGIAIANSYLANSAVTLGSTSVSLGSTVTTFAGVTLTSPMIDIISASDTDATASLWSGLTTGTASIAPGLTIGTLSIAGGAVGYLATKTVDIAAGGLTTSYTKVNIGPTDEYALGYINAYGYFTVKNGRELSLQAGPTDTETAGAIAFRNNSNTQLARIGGSASALSFIVGSGSTALATLDSTGTFSATTFNATSERSKKKDITDLKTSALDVLNAVQVVNYRYKTEYGSYLHTGFIADDTADCLTGKDHNVMALADNIGMLIKAVQELTVLNEQLEARIEALESK